MRTYVDGEFTAIRLGYWSTSKSRGHLPGPQALGAFSWCRFGPLSDETAQRILTAKASQLEAWSLNFVDAVELDDVFGD